MKYVKICENKLYFIKQTKGLNLDNFLVIHFFNIPNNTTTKYIKKEKR